MCCSACIAAVSRSARLQGLRAIPAPLRSPILGAVTPRPPSGRPPHGINAELEHAPWVCLTYSSGSAKIFSRATTGKPGKDDAMSKLSRTSVQLPADMLKWLDGWPGGVTRSEAVRIALERIAYLHSHMEHVGEVAETYKPILLPALEEFGCENFRTVARALPAIVGSYIQENDDYRGAWKDEFSGQALDTTDLYKKLEAMHSVERMYLLDCIVARRDWASESQGINGGRPVQAPPAGPRPTPGHDARPPAGG